MQSIRELGKPLRYTQMTDITYSLPFAQIAALDWISSSAAYNAGYRWERGALIEDENMGNYLQNDLSFTLQSRFNLQSLYNKIAFLRQANNLSDRELRDNNQTNGFVVHDVTQSLARVMTMVRQINVNIGYKTRTDLPAYNSAIGDFFGQQKSATGLIPGLGFAFGLEGGEKFVRKSLAQNRLVINEENLRPAFFNRTQNIRVDATIDPLPGLSINLHALHEKNQRTEMQYMFEGMPSTGGGSFAMSIISFSSEIGRAHV